MLLWFAFLFIETGLLGFVSSSWASRILLLHKSFSFFTHAGYVIWSFSALSVPDELHLEVAIALENVESRVAKVNMYLAWWNLGI